MTISDEDLQVKLVDAIGEAIERVLDEQQRRDVTVVAITFSALLTSIAGIASNLGHRRGARRRHERCLPVAPGKLKPRFRALLQQFRDLLVALRPTISNSSTGHELRRPGAHHLGRAGEPVRALCQAWRRMKRVGVLLHLLGAQRQACL